MGSILNCVLDAYLEHIRWLDIDHHFEWTTWVYHLLKRATHAKKNTMTYAGFVPYLYEHMLLQTQGETGQDLTCKFQINNTYVSYPELVKRAETERMKWRMAKASWPRDLRSMQVVDTIDLQPAIYCMLNEQHAFFAVEPPEWKGARPIMAFQFQKGE